MRVQVSEKPGSQSKSENNMDSNARVQNGGRLEWPLNRSVTLNMFYHGDLSDAHHGQSIYLNNLISDLEKYSDVTVKCFAKTPTPHLRKAGLETVWGTLFEMIIVLRSIVSDSKSIDSHRSNRINLTADAYGSLFPILHSWIRRIPLVYVASDTFSSYTKSLRSSKYRGAILISVFRWLIEPLLLGFSKLILVRSDAMKNELAILGIRESKIITLNHAMIPPPRNEPKIHEFMAQFKLQRGKTIVFIGNCRYPPNLKAAKYIISTLSKQMAIYSPDLKILLVGRGTDEFNSLPENVIALGEVEDIHTVIYSSDIGICPTDVTGGTSAKTMDYLSHGLIAIVTPEVCRSIPFNADLFACELNNFMEAIIKALRILQVERNPLRNSNTLREIEREKSNSINELIKRLRQLT